MSAEQEQILVVPTELFHRLGHFQGFSPDVERYLPSLMRSENLSFRPRDEMERDPNFKQLIPYAIFRHRDSRGHVGVFQYTRGDGQGEARLHAKQSIGVGGHISSIDGKIEGPIEGRRDLYNEGMRRELDEEVFIDSEYTQRCVGLINDDQTEVGRVHLGVVHVFDMKYPRVEPREPDLIEAGFRPIEVLLYEMERFETWSQICLKALF